MEENLAKLKASVVGSRAGPRLTAGNDGGKDDSTEEAIDMLDTEAGRQDYNAPDETSDGHYEVGPPFLAEHSE